MADTVITVRGSYDAFHPPERATVTLTVGHEGPDGADVYARTAATAGRVTGVLAELADPARGAVT